MNFTHSASQPNLNGSHSKRFSHFGDFGISSFKPEPSLNSLKQVAHLPKHVSVAEKGSDRLFKSYKDLKNCSSECTICLNNVKLLSSSTTVLKCWHTFHSKCIDTWLKKSSTCPTCNETNYSKDLNNTELLRNVSMFGSVLDKYSSFISMEDFCSALSLLEQQEASIQTELDDDEEESELTFKTDQLPTFIKENSDLTTFVRLTTTPRGREKLICELKHSLLLTLLEKTNASFTTLSYANDLLETQFPPFNMTYPTLNLPKFASHLLALSKTSMVTPSHLASVNIVEILAQIEFYIKTHSTHKSDVTKLSRQDMKLVVHAINQLIANTNIQFDRLAANLYDPEDLSTFPPQLMEAHDKLTDLVFNTYAPSQTIPYINNKLGDSRLNHTFSEKLAESLFLLGLHSTFASIVTAFKNRYDLATQLSSLRDDLSFMQHLQYMQSNNYGLDNTEKHSATDAGYSTPHQPVKSECLRALGNLIYSDTLKEIDRHSLDEARIALLNTLDIAVQSAHNSPADGKWSIETASLRKKFFTQDALLRKMETRGVTKSHFKNSLMLTHRKLIRSLKSMGASQIRVADFSRESEKIYGFLGG